MWLLALVAALTVGAAGAVLTFRVPGVAADANFSASCSRCATTRGWLRRIPNLSSVSRLGTHSACHGTPPVFFAISVAACSGFFAFIFSSGISPTNLVLACVASVTVPLSWIDFKTHRLPNKATYALSGIALSVVLASAWIDEDAALLQQRLIFGLAPAVFLFALNLVSRGAIGMGDVKLSLGLGLSLALVSPDIVLGAFLLAFLLGSLTSLGALIFGGKNLKSSIPFGPFLLAGAWLALILQPELASFANFYLASGF